MFCLDPNNVVLCLCNMYRHGNLGKLFVLTKEALRLEEGAPAAAFAAADVGHAPNSPSDVGGSDDEEELAAEMGLELQQLAEEGEEWGLEHGDSDEGDPDWMPDAAGRLERGGSDDEWCSSTSSEDDDDDDDGDEGWRRRRMRPA